MASKILTLGISLRESMALVIICAGLEQYFAFKEQFAP